MSKILVFGASGEIGKSVVNILTSRGNECTCASTTMKNSDNYVNVENFNFSKLNEKGPFHAVVWAQGCSENDNILEFSQEKLDKCMDANLQFTIKSVSYLLNQNKLLDNCNLVIIGSIWGEYTRPGKASYTISKAALGGLTKSLAADLAHRGINVNQVCPGPVDTKMTQRTLNTTQISKIKTLVPANRLVSIADVVSIVAYLCLENTGITGQSIFVDLGLSVIKAV